MKKVFIAVIGALLFASFIEAGEGLALQEEKYAYYDAHALPGDYVYRTEKVLLPQEEKKTIWE